MRPVLENCCRYESLLDGTVRLIDIARMNDALDVRAENRWRVEDALRRQQGSK